MRDVWIRGMIDMHSHILPDTDDGAASEEELKQMLIQAWEDGITTMVATPHYKKGFPRYSREELQKRCEFVRGQAAEIDGEYRIFLGQELYYEEEHLEALKKGQVLTMGESDYILVEFSPMAEAQEMVRGLQSIQMAGYQPILAHVERYRACRRSPELVGELISRGVCIQVNASSVRSKSRELRVFTKCLLRNGWVHFISSDAHDSRNRRPKLRECAGYIGKKYGRAYAELLFYKNARKMLNNEEIITWDS